MSVTIKMRVDEGDLERWKGEAERAGQTLSEWVRRKCNGVVGEINRVSNEAVKGKLGEAVLGKRIPEEVDEPVATESWKERLAWVVPRKYDNRYCKEHHVMGCNHCSEKAEKEGRAY